MAEIHAFHKGRLAPTDGEVVREFPLALIVNGQELATLIASPHDLRYLVAGFLRLQGFVSRADDFEMLSVCTDYGIANVRIKGELPERLRPVLTSGCGTGISFALPGELAPVSGGTVVPEAVFALMDRLTADAEQYRRHGGIHSAAVGDGQETFLYAEDLGRHNTLDRIAGEALLKGIDLAGMMLVTSGRVSTEMAAKASQLGISLIASRTSPTDMAMRLCDQAGITLIGYLRGGRFQVYSHPERLLITPPRIAGVTGVILAGGSSSRMGENKALIPYQGRPLIEWVYRQHAALFEEVLIVTNNPDDYSWLPCRTAPDLFPAMGALAGIHAGLAQCRTERIFVTACDMPYLDPTVIHGLAGMLTHEDALVPESDTGLEPLHAFYARSALQLMTAALDAGEQRIVDILPRLQLRVVPAAQVGALDPRFSSFRNVNTREDYARLMGERHEICVQRDAWSSVHDR